MKVNETKTIIRQTEEQMARGLHLDEKRRRAMVARLVGAACRRLAKTPPNIRLKSLLTELGAKRS